jgi:hypothetical protein
MDPRISEAILKLQELFNERAVIKAGPRPLSKEQQLRLVEVKRGLFESLDTLRDAVEA